MSLTERSRSLSRLLGNGVEQFGELLQNEIQLAQAELSEKAADAGKGVLYLAVTAVFLIPVITLLLIAFALWLKETAEISFALSFLLAALFAKDITK
jgi:hypothetical protein